MSWCFFLVFSFAHIATEACDGFCYLGVSAHWEEYCWNRAKSSIRDAEKFSGRCVFTHLHYLCINAIYAGS